MTVPVRLELVPLGDAQAFQDVMIEDDERTVADLLREAPALSAGQPLDSATLGRKVRQCLIRVVALEKADPDVPLFPLPGLTSQSASPDPASQEPLPGPAPPPAIEEAAVGVATGHPERLPEDRVVTIAYREPIRKLATFLRSRLSVLVTCEKLIVPYLWEAIVREVRLPASDDSPGIERRLEPKFLEMPEGGGQEGILGGGGSGQLGALRKMIAGLQGDQVLVIPNLDLLGGGGEKSLGREARELTELVYGALDRLVLAFVDPSLPVPEVLAARFAVRAEVEGLFRDVPADDGTRVPVGIALVEAGEAGLFADFEPAELYKNVAGLNPIRLRNALAYAVQVARDQGFDGSNKAPIDLLKREVRAFKAQTSEQFAVPDVGFDDIGGYEQVKATLNRAIGLMSGLGKLPDEKLRHELIPRGFLFHGPPGTGKTLFAKAIANQLNATIRVVSGPEVTDMYVGESERKVRVIFAEARRNAPSVIVFDEFDSIAARRTGRDDGGSRAGNALVAQILTEMDGFRPEVPILVIGTTNRRELIDEALLRPSRFQPVAIG
ncbi:MAG: ATP-binding protein, partial [bacterium]|nr:ATP-binding protein [bacterium]